MTNIVHCPGGGLCTQPSSLLCRNNTKYFIPFVCVACVLLLLGAKLPVYEYIVEYDAYYKHDEQHHVTVSVSY